MACHMRLTERAFTRPARRGRPCSPRECRCSRCGPKPDRLGCGDLYSFTPAGSFPPSPGAGNRVCSVDRSQWCVCPAPERRSSSRRARETARIAIPHFRNTKHPRLSPRRCTRSYKEVAGVWRRHIPKRSIRIFTGRNKLAHGPICPPSRDVGHDATCHLHRDERITGQITHR